MQLSTSEIALILGSRWEGIPRRARGYSIDSRTVHAGDLFFAIRGPRYDGHQFIGQAIERGAVGAVVERDIGNSEARSSLLLVPDAARALQQLAAAVRRKWAGRVVGITGSTGKTTTKEMLSSVLSRQFRVLKSEGNLNNHYGVPLTLLRLEAEHQVAVVEMAMSGPGEITRLAEIAGPEIGAVTNVAPAHLAFFDSVDAIARAKRELIEHLQPPAIAILNHDDERVRGFAGGFSGRVVTFGFTEGADYRGSRLRTGGNTASGTLTTEFEVNGPSYSGVFSIPVPGRHNVENALAVMAAASVFEVPESNLREGLNSFGSLSQRAEILRLPGPITLINDAYNSNPLAMKRMLEMIATWPGAERRLVLAGEMLELGPSSAEWHRQIGRECARFGVDWLIAVQGDARFFVDGAIEAGVPVGRTRCYAEAGEAARFCQTLLAPADLILVKGSRGVRLEKAVEILTDGVRQTL
ncbi:MAG: UDP-N-acetylmuramoyl-tripeptide--D-alanyl-D-alanine ligase [Terriglobia bacterium]